jgi:hypothetical protein
MARFRVAIAQLFKWLRSELGRELGYLMLMEWTTGSGGHGRLPHAHVLLKRLPPDTDLGPDCALFRGVRTRWQRYTGAWRIELRPLLSPAGAVVYMVGHHHKREQAPPKGWSGRRFRPSVGNRDGVGRYFLRPAMDVRADAQQEQRRKIASWKLAQRLGVAVADVPDEEIDRELAMPPPILVYRADPTLVYKGSQESYESRRSL